MVSWIGSLRRKSSSLGRTSEGLPRWSRLFIWEMIKHIEGEGRGKERNPVVEEHSDHRKEHPTDIHRRDGVFKSDQGEQNDEYALCRVCHSVREGGQLEGILWG